MFGPDDAYDCEPNPDEEWDPRPRCEYCGDPVDAADEPVGLCDKCRRAARDLDEWGI